MSPQRRHLSLYERAMEGFARTGAGTWYLKQIAPRIDPQLLRLTGGRVNPKVDVLAGKRSGAYMASEITDPDERERAWTLAVDQYAGYGDYEQRAGDRTIPLVRLERITA